MGRTTFLIVLAFSAMSFAQDPKPADTTTKGAPKTYFLKDARVVTAPGKVLEKASILLQNGKIAAVGASLTAPADAETIDCTGLTAYPGLIDPFFRAVVGTTAAAPPAAPGAEADPNAPRV